MGTVLEAIVSSSRRSALERAKREAAGIERQAALATPRSGAFEAALRAAGVRIIAECKRRSPSRGVLCRDYDPAAIAVAYERAGAAAVSVLTEPSFFDGSLDHLRAVRAAVSLPLLRKDFIVTEFQVVEARAAGADAVLLILAALTDAELKTLAACAAANGLAALVEVHSVAEAHRAVDHGVTILGVNSRDLRTLAVTKNVFDEIATMMPREAVAVAESGISSPSDIPELRRAGYRAFLIGERFMTTSKPGGALDAFLVEARAGGAA